MPDVLIVGAGPAGASLAIWLGRAGYEVVLFDKARFPRDKACGEGLMPSGVGALTRLGLVEALAGGTPFWGVRYHAGDRTAAARFPAGPHHPNYGLGQRRLSLDAHLAARARSTPGVTFLEDTAVTRLLSRSGRVVGLEAGDACFEAPLVALATGSHSPLRRQAGLEGRPPGQARLGLRAHYRLAEGQDPAPWVEVYLGDRRSELYVTPLPDRQLLVAALLDRGDHSGRPAEAFEARLRSASALAARLEGASLISPVIGAGPLESRATAGTAPGIVLVGDAAGFIDPITGGGMAQALLSAELLAAHMPRILTDPQGSALARFDTERHRMMRDYRWLTRAVLMLAEHPALARVAIGALASRPGWFSSLLGVSAGTRRLWPGD